MKKIYCKNCKWYDKEDRGCIVGREGDYFTSYELNHKGEKKPIWKNKVLFHKLFPSVTDGYTYAPNCDANKNFSCPFFKRKWWKIKGPKEGPKHLLVELLKEVESENSRS